MTTSGCSLLLLALVIAVPRAGSAEDLVFQGRRIVRSPADANLWQTVYEPIRWHPSHTAAVICDMWDHHWCQGATARVAEMAPRMNRVVESLRRQGVLIIHAPSDTMKFYADTPGRKLPQAAPVATAHPPLKGWCGQDPLREPPLPIDDSDGGCDDEPPCQQGHPWRQQIPTLRIAPQDAITDSAEAFNLMRQRGITNVLVMGVHQNLCVLGRPFSIRQMVYQGQNVVLIRDLTDSMYNSRQKPHVDHFTGNDLVTWHIEKYWCSTITSDQIVGGSPFRFTRDGGPLRQFEASRRDGGNP